MRYQRIHVLRGPDRGKSYIKKLVQKSACSLLQMSLLHNKMQFRYINQYNT